MDLKSASLSELFDHRDALDAEIHRRFANAARAIRRALGWMEYADHHLTQVTREGDKYTLQWDWSDGHNRITHEEQILESEISNPDALFVRIRTTCANVCDECGSRISRKDGALGWCPECEDGRLRLNPFAITDSPHEIRMLFDALLNEGLENWKGIEDAIRQLSATQLSELRSDHLLALLQSENSEVRLWAQIMLAERRPTDPCSALEQDAKFKPPSI